jgi:hypothetical protein
MKAIRLAVAIGIAVVALSLYAVETPHTSSIPVHAASKLPIRMIFHI